MNQETSNGEAGGGLGAALGSASVVEYKILYNEDPEELGNEVTNAMAEGWKPNGGVSVAQSDYLSEDHKGYSVDRFLRVFAQAMTLTPNDTRSAMTPPETPLSTETQQASFAAPHGSADGVEPAEPSYQAWLDSLAAGCDCDDGPCAGCQQGSICDSRPNDRTERQPPDGALSTTPKI